VESDLLDGCVRTGHRILDISRDRQLVTENAGRAERRETPFRILMENASGEHVELFDIVIDASGTWRHPNWMGSGGGPALGERELRTEASLGEEIGSYSCHIPSSEVLDRYAGSHFVLVGSGFTAATNLLNLAALRDKRSGLRCTWLTRKQTPQPLTATPDDPLPLRRSLVERINALAASADWLDWRPGSVVEAVSRNAGGFEIRLAGVDDSIKADHLLSNTGFHGDYAMLEHVQVHRCYASGGPMNWAASIAGSGGDCLQQSCAGRKAILTTEPDFYIIGSKSYGRDSRFLFATGLQQICEVFREICRRDTLDLYATMTQQVPAMAGSRIGNRSDAGG
jgi:hypothetical protein